jgi:hypothetical protein
MARSQSKIRVPGLAGAALVGALVAALATGCTSRVGHAAKVQGAEASPLATPAEGRWDASLPGDYLPFDDDFARRDPSLNIVTPGPLLASNQWPHAPQPSFERPRRVHLPREPENVLQFLPPYVPADRR